MPNDLRKQWPAARLVTAAALLTGVFSLDWACKTVAQGMLEPGIPMNLFPFVNLTLGYNSGISFGLFPAASEFESLLLILLTGAAVAAVATWSIFSNNKLEQIGLLLVVAGGASNLVDRMWNGAVTDFIDLYIGRWHWPAFNIADISITSGAVLILIVAFGGFGAQAWEDAHRVH